MAHQPARRTAGRAVDARRRGRLVRAYYDLRPDPSDPAPAGRVRDVRPSRLGAERRVQRGAHRRDDRGDLPLPRRRRASTGRCSSAATRTRCRSRRSATALEVLAANGVDVRVDAADGYTPTPVDLARDPRPTTAAAHDRPGRRDRRHAVAQPARGRRLQVQPAQRRPGRHRRHELDRGRGEPAARRPASTASARIPFERGARRARPPHDYVGRYVGDLGAVIDMDAIAGVRPAPRRRSARRRERRLLAGHRASATAST